MQPTIATITPALMIPPDAQATFVETMTQRMAEVARQLSAWVADGPRTLAEVEEQAVALIKDLPAMMLGVSRLMFAWAEDGIFPAGVAAVHRRFRTPHVAILITSVWSAFLTLTGGYETLFTYVTFASVLFGTLGGIAIFVLRVKRPDVPRPYRALGYPVIPALYVLGSFALVWNTLMERPAASIAGLGLVALGLPFYFYWSRTARGSA